ncbi:DUF4891 domain-containing protein [Bacteroides thetaiotaomicron]|uniref:DUF4891 domain-containing protein n=1 Tax=Bacteroides thetaiotaomicron TaxID=818 RepID=A0A415M491_BACT4|nr:DUF4891 domain-containing protein [Bacteroides thetaiotaomicron]RHL62342.1 DUF4891 domain-containing protein [Bacteroides thetaiotaomicron]
MKTILSCCLVIILAVSCQMKQNQNSDESINENMSVDNTETCMVDTVKATAIFWIDKAEAKHCKDSGLRTIKAKVSIHENGKVDFLSFTKKQSSGVEKYILHHLDKFQISKRMLEGGYIQTGEQFVQLRCMREKLQAMQ